MTRPFGRPDDVDPVLDRQLRDLLRDSVAGIEPEERFGELRARVSRPTRRRPALAVLAGAALTGAAVVVAVAVTGGQLPGADDDPADPPVASAPEESPGESPGDTASDPPSGAAVATRAVAGYYLGDTPSGVRLFREFRALESADQGPAGSVRLLTTVPADPDYRTEWPADAFAGAEVRGDRITLELADPALAERPDSMTAEEAEASVQQVVYTLQAYAQQQLPVEFTTTDGSATQVLGVGTDAPVAAEAPLTALSHVNLTTPDEGQPVTGGSLVVEGVANSFEGNVRWSLEDAAGAAVADGSFTAQGSMGERLFPFTDRVDVSSLAPGTYTLVVETEDPSGGAEGPGSFSDSRTVAVE